MKKLLITTMAAVSVGLCAKAEDANYEGTKTSFEDYVAGSTLTVNDEEDFTWTSSATDPLFVISNKNDFANWTKPSRPDYWATASDENALTIDTDAPLFCKVNGRNTTYNLSDGPIFFDSVVQFTATDVAAKPDSADKLRVWLYTSPDDVSETNLGLFDETSRKTCLVVTAGKYEGDLSSSNLNAEHYEVQIEGVEIQPDTWHRLTIKAIADIDPRADFYTPAFEIWIDGKPVTYGEGEDKKTQFPSLKRGVVNETLQCVAFDGKGAVDDIVFTTTEPEFAKKPEQKFVVTLNYESSDKLTFREFTIGTETVTASNGGTYEIPIGAVFNIILSVESGYTLSIQEDIELLIPTINQRGRHILTFTPTAVGTGTIEIKVNAGGVVTYPTVKPNGDSATQETLSQSAVAEIEAALAGVEPMPAALTVIVNEKEYFGDEAVAKINEVVTMFESAEEGETLKFFDASGIMKVSFKATNPLMETETAEATDYEAKVGEAAATVTSDYTVNKETVDLTPGVVGENKAVTFKLVIKPVSSTGSDTGSAVQE